MLWETRRMRWSFPIGTLFGIRLELHVTFVLFVGWVALTQGLLSGHPARAFGTVGLLLAIFACVVLHELGHALMARRFGIKTRDIVLLPIGGVARLQRMPDRPGQEVLVALAGPLVNVVIAALLWAILAALGEPFDVQDFRGGFLETLLAVNVFMVLFNMIPAFPMDGGRVLRALLALRLPYAQATRIAAGIGQGIALLFGVVGFFYNPMLLFIALFVFLGAGEEHAMVQARVSMSGLPARAAMLTEFAVLESADPLQRAVDLLMAGSQQDFPVLDRGAPIGVLTRDDLLHALQRHGTENRVGEVMKRDGLVADASEPLEDVFQRMRENQRSALPVVSHGRLAGLLTLENVTELLLVRDALTRHAGR
jgi:Zn-dependent protease/predicted transcriptional regulator